LETWEVRPVYAAVFGSPARGSMTTDSDLDLLLVRPNDVPDEMWAAQVDRLIEEVSRWIGNDVRPLQFTEADLASGREDPILRDVLSEGLTVAGSRVWLSQQLRRRGA
jgi:predicted nucleotidyltransferase